MKAYQERNHHPDSLDALLEKMKACRLCEEHLPLGPRPVARVSPKARLLIVGQAPGTKVHDTGIPWNDASGNRLRHWLGMGRDFFYDVEKIAIIPTGLCYPGRYKKGGDMPPRPECAPLWHPPLRRHLPEVRLILLVGRYAQKYYLGPACPQTLSETVARWREYTPQGLFPLPHPSWRTTAWQRNNPWFDDVLLPDLRVWLDDIFPGETFV